MRGLSAAPGLLSGTLVFAIATWWLAGIALQLGTDPGGLHLHTTQAAVVLVLGQCLLVALSTPTVARSRADLLAMSLPLWPLLVVLWLTSRLPWTTLIASQVIALLLAAVMLAIAGAIRRKVRDTELQQLLCISAGVACALLIWSLRAPLAELVSA